MEEEKDLLVKGSPLARLMESPEKAVEILNSIKANFSKLLKANKEIITIPTKQGKKEYVRYEGWVTIATVMGIMPRITELIKIDKGYQARAEAVVVKTGQVVGSAYGICSKDELTWSTRPDFSIAAMAQTRAAARALKTILGGVITHIGFEGTPAEIAEETEDSPTGYNCEGCTLAITAEEYDFSMTRFKKAFCRKCQSKQK